MTRPLARRAAQVVSLERILLQLALGPQPPTLGAFPLFFNHATCARHRRGMLVRCQSSLQQHYQDLGGKHNLRRQIANKHTSHSNVVGFVCSSSVVSVSLSFYSSCLITTHTYMPIIRSTQYLNVPTIRTSAQHIECRQPPIILPELIYPVNPYKF